MNGYNNGFALGQAQANERSVGEFVGSGMNAKHYQQEANKYNALMADRNKMAYQSDMFAVMSSNLERIAKKLADGEDVLMKPLVDRGSRSRVNFTSLMTMKKDEPKEYAFLMEHIKNTNDYERYGLA